MSPGWVELMVSKYLDGTLIETSARDEGVGPCSAPIPHTGRHVGRAAHGFRDCPVCLGKRRCSTSRSILFEQAGWQAFARLRDLGKLRPPDDDPG